MVAFPEVGRRAPRNGARSFSIKQDVPVFPLQVRRPFPLVSFPRIITFSDTQNILCSICL